MPEYTKHTAVELKSDPDRDENWLQEIISADPSILGLGDIVLIERERRHERAGRLDLLAYDPSSDRRYEIELMLGATDPSHIIRCIEYWDIERRRFPGYEHVAVLVAEDVTTRFLGVLQLFAGSIPLVVLQLDALQVDKHLLLNFVQVLDLGMQRRDDVAEAAASKTVDRAAWVEKATEERIVEVEALVNAVAESAQKLGEKKPITPNYVSQYVGIKLGKRNRIFVHFWPRKQFINISAQLQDSEDRAQELTDEGFSASADGGYVKFKVMPKDLKEKESTIARILLEATANFLGVAVPPETDPADDTSSPEPASPKGQSAQ
jgi:hypothetical protein